MPRQTQSVRRTSQARTGQIPLAPEVCGSLRMKTPNSQIQKSSSPQPQKRKSFDEDEDVCFAEPRKLSRRKSRANQSPFLQQDIDAEETWRSKSVMRFGLKGSVDPGVSDAQWMQYFRARTLLELDESMLVPSASCPKSEFKESLPWPTELGPPPEIDAGIEPCLKQCQLQLLLSIRASVEALVVSSSCGLDPGSVSRGVFLLSCNVTKSGASEPDIVTISTRLYAPNGSGNYINLTYESHKYACAGLVERYSHLYAFREGLRKDIKIDVAAGTVTNHRQNNKRRRGDDDKPEKIFELDLNGSSSDKLGKHTIATGMTLVRLGEHLFGTRIMSQRKMFSLLERAAGVGLCGENNKLAVSQARRCFKGSEGDFETDVESNIDVETLPSK